MENPNTPDENADPKYSELRSLENNGSEPQLTELPIAQDAAVLERLKQVFDSDASEEEIDAAIDQFQKDTNASTKEDTDKPLGLSDLPRVPWESL